MLALLPAEAREALERRLGYLAEMPRMYAITEDERFPGCRAFYTAPGYRVFYMVGAGSDEVYIFAVLPEDGLEEGMTGADTPPEEAQQGPDGLP